MKPRLAMLRVKHCVKHCVMGAAGAAVLLLAAAPGAAQTAQGPAIKDLNLVLARLTDAGENAGGCLATLRITTTGPATLATFSVRLVLFDPNGAVLRALTVLAMPVAPEQPTVATFPTGEDTCADIGALRALGFPLCADGDGRPLGCAGTASMESRVEGIPLLAGP